MGLFLEKGTLAVNVSNETMHSFRGSIAVSVRNQDFSPRCQERLEVSVKQLSSRDVFTFELPEMDPYHDFIAVDLFDAEGNFLTRRVETLVPPKHFDWKKPVLRITAKDAHGGVALSAASNTFTKGVFLDFRDSDFVLSDNFFPLTDEAPYTVLVRTDRPASEILEQLTVKTVYDIR